MLAVGTFTQIESLKEWVCICPQVRNGARWTGHSERWVLHKVRLKYWKALSWVMDNNMESKRAIEIEMM